MNQSDIYRYLKNHFVSLFRGLLTHDFALWFDMIGCSNDGLKSRKLQQSHYCSTHLLRRVFFVGEGGLLVYELKREVGSLLRHYTIIPNCWRNIELTVLPHMMAWSGRCVNAILCWRDHGWYPGYAHFLDLRHKLHCPFFNYAIWMYIHRK